MNQPSPYTAFLDSSVLFPVFISNLLLFLSESELFRARWSADVHREWIDSRMKSYPNADRAALERKRDKINREFPDALVADYAGLIESFDLDDPGDRHVVAAALRAEADVIVTDNPRDFPADKLPAGMLVQTADQFISDQFHLTRKSAWQVALAFIRHKKSLTKSRPNWSQYFQQLSARLPICFDAANDEAFRAVIANALRSRDWDYQ